MAMKYAITLSIAALLLAGCSSSNSDGSVDHKFYAQTVHLPDGRTVICVAGTGIHSGPSCDWDNAKDGQ